MSLLDEAKKIAPQKSILGELNPSREEMELAIAWYKGDITTKQASETVKIEMNMTLNYLSRIVKWGCRKGLIKICIIS